MGSWSESCGLSGLEINNRDEVYYSVLKPNKWRAGLWDFELLPIRGEYNDGGGIFLTEDYPFKPYGLKAGDEYTNQDMEDRIDILHRTYFVKASVFDILHTLPSDKSYRGYETIGAVIGSLEGQIACALEDAKANPYQIGGRETGVNKKWIAADRILSDAVRDREGSSGDYPEAYQMFHDYGLEFLPFFIRSRLLREASGELRTSISPSHSYCPQYGTPAQIPFFRFCLTEALNSEWRVMEETAAGYHDLDTTTLHGAASELCAVLGGLEAAVKHVGTEPGWLDEQVKEVRKSCDNLKTILNGVP